ncbi:hypothetical protein TVAG_340460 [Trichomonas vaginalis G3]|uniref:Uncharacterized protein n=1 Tax=Trichomonas vaginalis (strain ATCC PRA-98 / G3) TaxID=412133 RepID=A2EKG0_TRIV3|nr:armadillo (ARM) repeat-containing protein family [Trichomonas vaginalis G3]EAY06868.1 hypothetical protein TVAG_340460 [Trichomonas vaginalis G3]KAI5489188.1 armadillo (ARM) repeat-containing protein family [Trichomonas vaginalis G3]|eukprot:XP_001319091.1 hypothetical protein [Trichomonas vaginalis G3]
MKNVSIKELFSSKDQSMVMKCITYLRNKQIDLMLQKSDPAIVYKSIFAELEEKPSDFDQLEWDKMRFIAYLAFAQLLGNDFLISSTPILTKYGPLFSCLCFCCIYSKDKMSMTQDLTKILLDYLQKLLINQQALPFYSHNSATDVKHILSFLTHSSVEKLKDTFLQVDINKLTYSDYSILYDSNLASHQNPNVIRKFFTSEISPSFIIDRFFKFWRKIFDTPNLRDPKENQGYSSPEIAQSVEKISKIFESATYQKYSEISPNFRWREIFNFFEMTYDATHQGRVMLFIDYALRTIKKMHVEIEAVMVSRLFCNHYKKNISYSYYPYFMQGVISAIRRQTLKLMNVRFPMLLANKDAILSTKYYFKDQNQNNSDLMNEIDKVLYTQVNPIIVQTQEAGDALVDKCNQKFEQITYGIEAPLTFGVVNTLEIISKIGGAPEAENEKNSTIFFGVREFLEYAIKLLVALTYKITEERRYAERQFNRSSLSNLTLFPSLFSTISSLFKDLPSTFENVAAQIICQALFEAVQNHEASIELIQAFAESSAANPSLFRTITRQMIFQALQIFPDLTDFNFEKASTVTNWVFFLIRFSIKIDNSGHNLIGLFHFYKSPIVIQTFRNISMIANPLTVLKLFRVILKIANRDGAKIDANMDSAFLVKIIEDLKGTISYIQNRFLDVFFTVDKLQNLIPFHIQLIEMCLTSGDKKLIDLVSPIITKFINTQKLKSDLESDSLRNLISKWYSVMNQCSPDDLYEMLKCMQNHPSTVLSPIQSKNFEEIGVTYESVGCDISKFLSAIFKHVKEDDEEAAHLLALLNIAFEIIKEEFTKNSKRISDAIRQILFITNYISKFSKIRGKVLAFTDKMNEFFVQPFCTGYSTAYLINLFITCGSTESKSSQFMELVIERYLAKCQAFGYPVSVMETVVDQIYEMVYSEKWFAIKCCAFLFITKYCIKALPPRRLEFQLYLRSVDEMNFKTFNKFLKAYEQGLDEEGKREYVMAIYNCRNFRLNNILLMFIHRTKKLKVPVQIESFSELNPRDYMSFFIHAILIINCGCTQGMLPTEVVIEIQNFTKMQNEPKDKQILTFLLIDAILEHQSYADLIFPERTYLINFIHRFIGYHQTKNKLIKKLLSRSIYNLSLRFPNDTNVIGYLKQQASAESQIFYYIRTIPHLCNPSFIKGMIMKIKLFSDDDPTTNNPQVPKPSFDEVVRCFKVLGSDEWMEIPGVQDQIQIDTFIAAVLNLMASPSIPFWPVFGKSVLNFCVRFSGKVTNNLYTPRFITNPRASQLMEYFIINDKSNAFLQEFIAICQQSHDLSNIPFLFIRIFQTLVKVDRFAKDPNFVKDMNQIFHKLLDNYSKSRFTNDLSFVILSVYAEAYLDLIKQELDSEKIFTFSELFIYSEFRHADISSLFKHAIFGRKDANSQNVYQNIIFQCSTNISRYDVNVLDILLSNSLKSCPGANYEMVWTILVQNLEFGYEQLYYTSIHNVRIILQLDFPVLSKFPMFARFIPAIMSKSNPDNIIETFKALTIYSKKSTMPPRLLYDIIKHIFINGALIENPYKRDAFEFLHANEKSLDNLPLDVIESIHIFITDRLGTKFSIPLLKEFPIFEKYLPFSAAANTAHNYWTYKEKQANLDLCIWHGIQFCINIELTEEEKVIFSQTIIDYIIFYIKDKERTKTKINDKEFNIVMINLLQFIMKKPQSVEFPEFIVRELVSQLNDQSIPESIQVVIFCCMMKYCSLKLISENFKYVKEIFESLRNNRIMTIDNFFKHMASCILGLPTTETQYFQLIIESITYLFSFAPCRTYFIKARILIEEVSKSNHPQIEFLTEARDSLIKLVKRYNSPLISDIIAILIEKAVCLKPEFQYEYIFKMLSTAQNQLIMASHKIITNSKVDPKVRFDLIKAITKFVTNNHINVYERLLTGMQKFSEETNIDTSYNRVRILICQAISSNPSTRVKAANEIIQILGDDEKIRFNLLVDIIPFKMWSNSTLPFMSLLISKVNNDWNTLVALSNLFEDVSIQISTNCFSKILDETTVKSMRTLLCHALESRNGSRQFTNIIQAIVTAFSNSKLNLPFELVRKSTKFAPLQWALEEYIDENTDDNHLVLWHEQNLALFGKLVGKVPTEELAAAAAFFLRNPYQTATAILSMLPSTHAKSIEKLKKLSIYFSSESNFVTHMVRNSDSTPDIMLDEIEKLSRVITVQPGDSLKGDISSIRKMNIQYIKSRPYMTAWQASRALSIQFLVSFATDFANNGKLTERIPFNVFHYISNMPHLKFLSILGASPFDTVYQNSWVTPNGECLILPHYSLIIFKEIAGMMKYSDIAVPIEKIEPAILNFQSLIMKRDLTIHHLIAWMMSSYHIFMNTPIPVFLKTAVDASLATLTSTSNNSTYAIVSAGQIVSLLRLGYGSNDRLLNDAAFQASQMIGELVNEKKDSLMFWAPQILSLMEKSAVKDSIQDSYKTYEFFNAYYTFRRRQGSNDYLKEPSIAFLHELEVFVDYLFSLDWTTYMNQKWLKTLIQETAALPDDEIEKIDIPKISNSVPTSSFEVAVHKTHHWFNFCNNFTEFAMKCKESVSNRTVLDLLAELLPSEKQYQDTKKEIESHLQQVNLRIRSFMPSKHFFDKIQFRRFTHEIEKISDDTFVLQAMLFEARKVFIAITRAEANTALNVAVNLLQSLANMAKENPLNVTNVPRLTSPISMNIGPNYRATFYMTPPQYMTSMFYEAVGVKTTEWEATPENIQNLPTERAMRYLSTRFTKMHFVAMRNSMLQSVSASSSVRHLLGTNYPNLNEIVLLLKSGEISLLPSSITNVSRDIPELSSFRLSPNISSLLGPGYKGKLAFSMSHFMTVYNDMLPLLIPMIHLFYIEKFNIFEMSELKQISDNLVARSRQLVLPNISCSTEKDAVDWMETVLSLIDAASIPDDKPVESIPWF